MNIQFSIISKGFIALISLLLVLIIYYLIHIGNIYVERDKQIKISNRRGLKILLITFFIYVFYALVNKYDIISNILLTVAISIILSYLFNPIINYLENHNISRSLGIIILYIVILGIFITISISFIPRLGRELKGVVTVLPGYFERITKFVRGLYDKYYSSLDAILPLMDSIEQVVFENIGRLQNLIVTNLSKLFTGVGDVFNKIVSLILIPILTFYFLRDKDQFANKLYLTVPKNKRAEARELFTQMDKALSQFIRGRLILAIYVGIATTIILLILDVNFAIVIGLLTGIADVIPYFGPFLGFLPAVVFAFLDSPMKGVWVAIIFMVIQWVENNVLAPKIIGDSTGLHPITVLLSLIIAGGMFGVMGMIFAVPIVSVLKILFGFFIDKIRKRNLISK